MERTIFEEEHKMLSVALSANSAEQEVAPHHEKWEKEGIVLRELWEKLDNMAFGGWMCSEECGGGGIKDFRYNAIVGEELIRVGASVEVGFGLHSDIVIPYILAYGGDEQKQRWLPKMVSGEMITAIAMSANPAHGSDLQGGHV
ncbi:MAG: acyl-CoA dehydrogenase family protein, partial [Anaerolineae bacterium]|nr:acyl-CoA dehydrogenase family protein [Anaerolineae bacterium]